MMETDPATTEWKLDLSPKQEELRQLCRKYRFVLANGPRFSGKTIGAYHCLLDHAWLTPNGNIAIITISQTVGLDSGVWKDLTEIIIPHWISGNFGMEWKREPYIQGTTKKPACQVTNQYGGSCTIQLESLKDENEVEDRFKPRRYSMIYVPELSTFHDRKTFDTWTECLRMIGLPEDAHLFLADSNPCDDDSWWIHDLWWDLLELPVDDIDQAVLEEFYPAAAREPEVAREALLTLKRNLARIDIAIEDNPFADPQHVSLLKAKYAHNDELYRRYIIGECVRTTENSLFHKVFRPSFHVVGDVSSPVNRNPDILVPEEGCIELITGMDPGSSNSAAVIAEKTFRSEDVVNEEGKKVAERQIPILKYLDELVIVDEPHSLEDFVLELLKKMAFWEEWIGRPGKTLWRHWSDRSVFDMKSPDSEKYFHQIIYEASAMAIERGDVIITAPIILEAAARGPGSVQNRVDLFQKLLYDERAFFSAEKCPELIAAIKGLKRGTNSVQVIAKGSKHKHVWDAASYLASSELHSEMTKAVIRNVLNQRKASDESRMVVIPT